MPEITGTRFGRIEYFDEDVVTFEEGLVGFPELKGFLLLSTKENSPFRWLQSLDAPVLAFLVADPEGFVAEYQPPVPFEGCADSVLVYTTASIPPGRPEEMTLNLAGPIFIEAESRKGKQSVLDNEAYTIKHRVMVQPACAEERAAA